MTEPHHILIIDDDEVTRAKLAGHLEVAGYRVSEAVDGAEMQRALSRDPADLILLDINLPGEDGLDLTRKIRNRSNIGIILVTSRTDEVDRIIGLEIGADDYITKPFNPRELLARVKSVLRRAAQSERPLGQMRRFSGWGFDMLSRQLESAKGERVPLTRAEYELLSAFVKRPGIVLSRDRLLDQLTHRMDEPGDRTIDALVRRLRKKLEADPKIPEIIITAHGEGYVFAAEVSGY
ncbi:MAG: two-component system response regulator TorR [Rhodospirillaceae bacterium]|nr:two-component system response regulator TorR [Rhodospirillaceae bacterium]MBL6930689.1 two-component system response regulator TorR [Rhodospirillales bacterium]MBL6940532.1 two-component system response regulator TorR [Rhodospirillales bacterium]